MAFVAKKRNKGGGGVGTVGECRLSLSLNLSLSLYLSLTFHISLSGSVCPRLSLRLCMFILVSRHVLVRVQVQVHVDVCMCIHDSLTHLIQHVILRIYNARKLFHFQQKTTQRRRDGDGIELRMRSPRLDIPLPTTRRPFSFHPSEVLHFLQEILRKEILLCHWNIACLDDV